jgi:hypothetical protein
MSTRSLLFAACLSSLLVPLASNGHHSFPQIFNTSQVVDIEGTIVVLNWRNPHVTFAVLTANGERWDVESNSTRGMERYGVAAEALAVGTVLTVAGFPARNGDQSIYSSNLLLNGGVEYVIRPGSEPRWSVPVRAE